VPADHPLAARLLTLDGVYNVLLVQDFVTVNKLPQVEWPPLQTAVMNILSDYLSQHAANHAG
jgi:Scaffold protein Nfu/NifU N terminal